MRKIGIAILLGIAIASPVYAQLVVGRQFNKSTVSPVKRFYAVSSGSLSVLNYQTSQTAGAASAASDQLSMVTASAVVAKDAVVPEVIGRPLNYPNPFRAATGTTIYYELSKNLDVEIAVFDMMANQIHRSTRNAGSEGGLSGRNKVSLEAIGLNSRDLSSGAYFYVIMHGGKVLAKGKMAVVI